MNPTVGKISAGTLGAGIAVISVYLLELFVDVKIPGEVVAAATGIFTTLASLIIPDRMEKE